MRADTPIPINMREHERQSEELETQSMRDLVLSYIFVGFSAVLLWLALALL